MGWGNCNQVITEWIKYRGVRYNFYDAPTDDKRVRELQFQRTNFPQNYPIFTRTPDTLPRRQLVVYELSKSDRGLRIDAPGHSHTLLRIIACYRGNGMQHQEAKQADLEQRPAGDRFAILSTRG